MGHERKWKSAMMKALRLGLLSAALGAAWVGSLGAQAAPERLELTMKLLPEKAADAAQIIHQIQLPPAAETPPAAGRPTEPPGAEHGQGQGQETAAEAREQGREFGQSVAEQARENRENKGRGEDPPGRPENPGPPDNVPGPPATPGRP
jgi:hypothetical protein